MDGTPRVQAPVPPGLRLPGVGAPGAGRRGGLACTPAGQYRKDDSYSSHEAQMVIIDSSRLARGGRSRGVTAEPPQRRVFRRSGLNASLAGPRQKCWPERPPLCLPNLPESTDGQDAGHPGTEGQAHLTFLLPCAPSRIGVAPGPASPGQPWPPPQPASQPSQQLAFCKIKKTN